MSDDRQIEALLVAWKDAQAQDPQITIEEFCRECPELLPQVLRRIEEQERHDNPLSRTVNETPRQNAQTSDAAPQNNNAEKSLVQTALTDNSSTRPRELIAGRYKLLQQIGEGGMGAVYMAEQVKPVHRFVAVKIIKPGMDSREVIARFEAERQALALMDHPNIAKVLDAGTTDQGHPYFVMELVKGVPITDYCDERRLSPRERLELFMQVCQGVQHAHQKGIIHRDLKPSNILVAQYDGHPVPKVIDFGVAKATGQKLTDNTMFTAFGAIVGTLEYMSPEQAQFNQLDIDTRSDVYSLGVLLYELLTGSTPFDRKRLTNAALLEILKAIREEEPPRPSTRLDTTEELRLIAANRGLEPRKLSVIVRGDLDWIVMKALDKDRNRRYETANGMALDIQRYLTNEPVSACPPSTMYRLRKLAMKNRPLFFAGCIATVSVLAGIVGLAISRELISQERDATANALLEKESALDAARAAEAQEAEQRQIAESRRREADHNLILAREAVDRFLTRAAEDLRGLPQMERVRRALLDDALTFYQGFLKENSDDPAIRFETGLAALRIGNIHCFLGQWSEGISNYLEASGIFQKLTDSQPENAKFREQLAECHHQLGRSYLELHRYDTGIAELEQSIALWDVLITESPNNPHYKYRAGQVNLDLGGHWRGRYRFKRGAPYIDRFHQLRAELVQRFPEFPVTAQFMAGQAVVIPSDQSGPAPAEVLGIPSGRDYNSLPHDAETLKSYEQELRKIIAQRELEVEAHPGVPNYERLFLQACGYLANVLCAQDRVAETEQLAIQTSVQLGKLALRYPDNTEYQVSAAWSDYNCGHLLYMAGRKTEARDFYRRAIESTRTISEQFPDELRHRVHLVGMLIYCPDIELREPQRCVAEELRILELGGTGSDRAELGFAQVQAGLYEDALQSVLKAREDYSGPEMDLIEAIVRLHLNQKEEAARLYKRSSDAIASTTNKQWYAPQYRLIRAEFDARMGIRSEPRP